jgi:hypothetical protein
MSGPTRVVSAPTCALRHRPPGLPDPPDHPGDHAPRAASYRVADLAELYRQRWPVDTALAQLKTAMQMDVLHGQTVPGVLKELTVLAIVYHLVLMVMCQSARR